MAKRTYKDKIPRKFFMRRVVAPFIRLVKRKPQICNLSGGELQSQAIFLSNHSGANGPVLYEVYFPLTLTDWGAHEMCEGFRTRWHYLYHTFYRQKLHWGKLKSFFVATVFAPISGAIYRGIGLIPTYTDSRFISTVRTSTTILDKNHPLLIFPEDSEEGYKEPPEEFNRGFISMAKLYYKLRKVDLPVYCMYLFREKGKRQKIIIAPPIYVNKMIEEGKSDEEICAEALAVMRSIYTEHGNTQK